MPVRHAVMHFIDKKPDGSPAVLHLASSELPGSGAIDNLLFEVNGTYNAKTGKAWGYFHGEFGVFRAGDYGISESFAADKRALNQYRRYSDSRLVTLLTIYHMRCSERPNLAIQIMNSFPSGVILNFESSFEIRPFAKRNPINGSSSQPSNAGLNLAL